MKKTPDFDAAAEFMATRARVLDRRVFQRLFQGGAPEPVRDAVAAYRNDDGGFGHALEPDLPAAASQPAAVEMALRIMDAADAWDEHLVRDAIDWLTSIAPSEGGATFVLPTLSQGPHAPWWVPAEGNPVSLIQTGQIAGVLYARGFNHPWRDGATEVMWRGIDQLTEPNAYEMFGVLAFLQHVPDRSRAEDALQRIGPVASRASSRSTRTPRARPTPRWTSPRSPTRSPAALFDDATIEAHLNHLAGAQREDGGWMFNWPAWSPAAESDWRGFLTVDALRVLRATAARKARAGRRWCDAASFGAADGTDWTR